MFQTIDAIPASISHPDEKKKHGGYKKRYNKYGEDECKLKHTTILAAGDEVAAGAGFGIDDHVAGGGAAVEVDGVFVGGDFLAGADGVADVGFHGAAQV